MDKLDILRVVQNSFVGSRGAGISSLPKGEDISKKVLADLTNKENVRYDHIQNKIDWLFYGSVGFSTSVTILPSR